MSQFVRRRARKGRRPSFDLSYLKRVAEAHLIEDLTYVQIEELYGVSRRVATYWVSQFSEEILSTNAIGMNSNPPQSKSTIIPSPPGELELSRALENANLKIAALEIAIQIAEEELGINIRKKYGTKQ